MYYNVLIFLILFKEKEKKLEKIMFPFFSSKKKQKTRQ